MPAAWCLTFITPTSRCSWVFVSSPTANSLQCAADGETGWDLNDLIETVPNIPPVLKRSILEDVHVSKGLLYLHKHSPQIIHRDLTAKNVLLKSYFMAKITDLGNSRIVNLQPGQLARMLSRLPGILHDLHASQGSFIIILLQPQPWYLLVWLSGSLYSHTGTALN